MAVDAQFLYWSQLSRGLVRGPKDGNGETLRLGTWNATAVGQELVVAGDVAYWLDMTTLKMSNADASGYREVALPWYGSNLAVAAEFAYVTTRGCAAIARVSLSDWEIQTVAPEQPASGSAGRSYLAVDGERVYCAGWQRVFVFDHFGPGLELTDAAEKISGLAIADGALYYLDRTVDTMHLKRLSETDSPSKPEILATENVLPQSPLLWDPPREQLLFTSSRRLYSYSLVREELEVLVADIHSGGGLAVDETHVYWGNSTPNTASIERMRLD